MPRLPERETIRKQNHHHHRKRRNRVFIVQLFHCRFWRCSSTILATSFLLCGEEVTIYENGKEVRTEPASSRKVVDFGKGVGKRGIFLYNLPEVVVRTKYSTSRPSKLVLERVLEFGTQPWLAWLDCYRLIF